MSAAAEESSEAGTMGEEVLKLKEKLSQCRLERERLLTEKKRWKIKKKLLMRGIEKLEDKNSKEQEVFLCVGSENYERQITLYKNLNTTNNSMWQPSQIKFKVEDDIPPNSSNPDKRNLSDDSRFHTECSRGIICASPSVHTTEACIYTDLEVFIHSNIGCSRLSGLVIDQSFIKFGFFWITLTLPDYQRKRGRIEWGKKEKKEKRETRSSHLLERKQVDPTLGQC